VEGAGAVTFFSEANRDADTIALAAGATGPRIGFLDAFEASRQAQMRASAMFGLEAAFREAEQEQIRSIRDAGGKPPRSLNDSEDGITGGFTGGLNSRRYLDAARYYVDGEDRDGIAGVLAEREKEIGAVAEQFPNLKLRNMREVFETAAERAKSAERTWENANTTVGGAVGGFLGGAVGALDPRTDPFNFLTLPAGAIGRTALARIGSQSGAQGLIEGVNQLTGVQENRRLLGLQSGLAQGALSVAAAAVGGGALQGIGEGVAAGARRWFRSAPNDPAPPPPVTRPVPTPEAGVPGPAAAAAPEVTPPRVNLLENFDAFDAAVRAQQPLGTTRRAAAVAAGDEAYFARALDDWSGPRPWEVPPRADTAMPGEVTTARFVDPYDRVVNALETPEQVARRIDPETFRVYDKLDETANRLRSWLSDLDAGRMQAALKSTERLDAEIAVVEKKLGKASAKNIPRLERELADLRAARDMQAEAVLGVDTGDQATIRKRLLEVDQQMRDLAPLVSRAHGLAEGEWRETGVSASTLQILRDLQQRGGTRFRDPVPPRALADDVPVIAARPDVVAAAGPNADAADMLKTAATMAARESDPVVKAFRDSIAMLKSQPDPVLVLPSGRALDIDKTTIFVPDESGAGTRAITVRQYLDEVAEDDAILKAVSTCSIGPAS
jgi:hypothetical protein